MSAASRLPAVAAIVLTATGCGGGKSADSGNTRAPEVSPPGDIPDNQAYVRYAPANAGYSVKVPEGWARRSARGSVTFTDKLNAIRVEAYSARSLLTVAAAKRVELPKLESSVEGLRSPRVNTVARPAGRAVRIAYLASGPTNEVTGKATQDAVERYLFSRDGRRVVLTLSGPRGADNVDPWRIVTASLRWTR